jgi:hypothetical protein
MSKTRPNSWQQLSNDLLCPFITPRHGLRRKYSLPIVEKACLLIRRLVMDVLLLRAYASAGICLLSRCLAVGLYVTILKLLHFPNKRSCTPHDIEQLVLP